MSAAPGRPKQANTPSGGSDVHQVTSVGATFVHSEHQDPNCIFCKIVEGKIPSRKVYEDDEVFGFHDIAPWAPVHFMLLPKRHIPSMAQLTPDDAALMGKIMTLAPRLALELGCNPYPRGGFRVFVNTGAEGGQEVHHLHVHVIGGPRPWLKG